MRTSVTTTETKTFDFPMTDADVLARVDEINELKTQENTLENKKKIVQQGIKSLQTQMSQMFSNIANREEPREVSCEVIFDYDTRMVETLFEGEVMESRKMSEWEYDTRPEDIYPRVKKTKVSEETASKSSLAEAAARAEEIVEKEANNQVPSANVNAHSEARTETAVEGLNV